MLLTGTSGGGWCVFVCVYISSSTQMLHTKKSLAMRNLILHCAKMSLSMDFKFLSPRFTASCSTVSQLKHPLDFCYKWWITLCISTEFTREKQAVSTCLSVHEAKLLVCRWYRYHALTERWYHTYPNFLLSVMATTDFFLLNMLANTNLLSVILLLLLLVSGISRLLFFPHLHIPFFIL